MILKFKHNLHFLLLFFKSCQFKISEYILSMSTILPETTAKQRPLRRTADLNSEQKAAERLKTVSEIGKHSYLSGILSKSITSQYSQSQPNNYRNSHFEQSSQNTPAVMPKLGSQQTIFRFEDYPEKIKFEVVSNLKHDHNGAASLKPVNGLHKAQVHSRSLFKSQQRDSRLALKLFFALSVILIFAVRPPFGMSFELLDFVSGVSGLPQSSALPTGGRGKCNVVANDDVLVVEDKAQLSKSSFINTNLQGEDFYGEQKLEEHALRRWPLTAAMLTKFEQRLYDMDCPAPSKQDTKQSPKPQSSQQQPDSVPIAPHNQSLTSETKAIQSFLDDSQLNFENSIGMMNKQQFFGEFDRGLMSAGFFLEDELYVRLHTLASVTCNVVKEDGDESEGVNIRRNPQKKQLRPFCQMVGGDINSYDGSIAMVEQDQNAEAVDSLKQQGVADIQMNLKSDEFTKLSPFFKDKALRTQQILKLKQSLNFHVSPTAQKNTTFYIDTKQTESARNLPEARLSHKFYASRFPEIAGASEQDFQDDKIVYDENSIHYKELHFFDDMIRKINDEKEMWPGIKIADANSDKESQPKNKKAPQEQCAAPNSGTWPPGFSPPFGSFQKDMFGSRSVHPYPVAELKYTEKKRVISKILNMKALHHHKENFEVIDRYLYDSKTKDAKQFSKLFFTYEESDYIETLTQGVIPRNILDLSVKNGHSRFFRSDIDISPKIFNQTEPIYLLTPKMDVIIITNTKPKGQGNIGNIVIADVLSSSPEVSAFLDDAQTFPITLRPSQSVKIQIVATAEHYGNFEALLYFLVDKRILVSSYNATVHPNKFGLAPIYYDRIQDRDEINHALTVANPYQKQIYVEEFYITNKQFKADFKTVYQQTTNSSQKSSKNQINFIIESNSNRTFCNILYKANVKADIEETIIVIRFSTGDFIRIPFYVRTINSIFETSPSLVDFGLVQLNQKPLKMKLTARINLNKIAKIYDYYLPLDQPNLDFHLLKPPGDLTIDKSKKNSQDHDTGRQKLQADQGNFATLEIGHVYLNPVRAQFIATSIKVEIQLKEDKQSKVNEDKDEPGHQPRETMFVEIPIIGSVVNHTTMFSAIELSEEQSANGLQPLPLYLLDTTEKVQMLPGQTKKEVQIMPNLMLKNNLLSPIVVTKVIFPQGAENSFAHMRHHNSLTQYLLKAGGFEQPPGTTVAYGDLDIRMNELKFRQGYQMLWLQINQTLVPAQVQVYSRSLYCQWQTKGQQPQGLNTNSTKISNEDQQNVTLCSSLRDIHFGDLQIGVPKSKILKIANVNPVAVSLEQAFKSSVDDLSLELEKVTDKYDIPIQPVWKTDHSGTEKTNMTQNFEIMNAKRTKKLIGLTIQPFESVYLRLKVLSSSAKIKVSNLELTLSPKQFDNINITYSYNVYEGSLAFQPQVYKFLPSFQGMPQDKILTARSNFSNPVEILSVRSTDPRIATRILNKEIKPWNMSISGIITYDAGKTGMEKHSDYIKSISQFSIENPPTLQIDAYNLQKMQAKKNTKGAIQSGNSDIFQKFQSLSDKEILQMIKNLEPNDGANDASAAQTQPLISMNLKGDDHGMQGLLKSNSSFIQIPLKDSLKGASGFDHDQTMKNFEGVGQHKGFNNKQNTGLFSAPDKDFKVSESINYRDILAWRERQEEWKELERHGKNIINSTLEIETSLLDRVYIPIEASLKKPEIILNDSLDFGEIQVGQSVYKDLLLQNPTSETLKFQLFVSYDLDESYISRQTDKVAWMDKGAFRDKMQRQIDIYMKGVSLDLVEQIEYMFDQFKQQNASNLQSNYDNVKNKSRRDMIEILLSYNQQRSFEEEHASAGIDEILNYDKEFDKELQQNYVSKYCTQIFLEHSNIYEYNSFKHFYDETTKGDINMPDDKQIGWNSYRAKNQLLISEKANSISQCLFSIQYVGLLEKQMNTNQKEQEVTAAGGQKHEYCDDHDFTIQSIQNYYRRLYQNVYDYDWKINNSMEKCNLTMPLEQLENLNSVDGITQVLRSIFYHDTLQTWKRWQLASNRYQRSLVEAQATRSGPIMQYQERYIYYLSNIVPYNHVQYERYITKEERKGFEANLRKLDLSLDWFRTGKVNIEINNPDQIQQVVNKAWEDDLEENKKKEEAKSLDAYGHKNYFAKASAFLKDTFFELFEFVGKLLEYDPYEYTSISQNDRASIINPLSSINDRFKLKNKDIQQAMIKNNVLQKASNIKQTQASGHRSKFKQTTKQFQKRNQKAKAQLQEQPIQNFYLNPKYKEKVFQVPPHQNFTVKDAVIFEPQVIEQQFNAKLQDELEQMKRERDALLLKLEQMKKAENPGSSGFAHARDTDLLSQIEAELHNKAMRATKMQLLIKNNLTIIESMQLKGYGTSAMLELVDLQKDFTMVAEQTDEQAGGGAKPVAVVKRVSVADTYKYNLTAFRDIPAEVSMSAWDDLEIEEQQKEFLSNMSHLLGENGRKEPNLHGHLAGSELYVINHLFDEKTQAEYFRKQNQPGKDLTVTQQLVANSYHQKNFLKKNDRFLLSLKMQSFKNYIPFNIPTTDIFKKKASLDKDDAESQNESAVGSLFYVDQAELVYPEDSIDPNDPEWIIEEERNKSLQEQQKFTQQFQQKMVAFLDKPKQNSRQTIRQQVSQTLKRWDNQDFRVDVNWTDFEYHVLRNKIKLVKDHTRYLVFQNSGTLPVKITNIRVDEAENSHCSDPWGILYVANCKKYTQFTLSPKQKISLQLVYHETFQFVNTKKSLTIETEHFSQKFYLDFSISERAQSLAHRIENKYFWNENPTAGNFMYLVQFFHSIFTLALLYSVMIMALTMRRVYDDQIMIVNGIFPILDTKQVKLRQPDKKAGSSGSEVPDLSSTIFSHFSNPDYGGSLMTKKETTEQYILINQKMNSIHNSKDFSYIANSKYISQVLPSVSYKGNGLPASGGANSSPNEKTCVYESYHRCRSKTSASGQGLDTEALAFTQKKSPLIFEAQRQASLIIAEQNKHRFNEHAKEFAEAELRLQKQSQIQLEQQILADMSKKSPEEQLNTGIKFYRDDHGVVSYKFVKLNEISPENRYNIKKLAIKSQNKLSIEPLDKESPYIFSSQDALFSSYLDVQTQLPGPSGKQQVFHGGFNQIESSIKDSRDFEVGEEAQPPQRSSDTHMLDDINSPSKVLDIDEWNRKQSSMGFKPHNSEQPEMLLGQMEFDQKRAEHPGKPANQPLSKKQRKQLMIQKQQENARAAALARQQEAMLLESQNREKERRQQEQQLEEQAILEEQRQQELKQATEKVEQKEKKQKVKKLTKAELKKKDQRLKKEQELADNTKRLEQAQREQELREARMKEMRDKQQDEGRKKSKSESDSQEEKTNAAPEPTSFIEKHEENVIDIQSYHSSEENFQRGKEDEDQKQKRAADPSGERRQSAENQHQERWEQIETDGDDWKHSLNSGAYLREQNKDVMEAKSIVSGYQPHGVFDFSKVHESQDHQLHAARRFEDGEVKIQTQSTKDDNFWANYEKNLGIVQEEFKEQLPLHPERGIGLKSQSEELVELYDDEIRQSQDRDRERKHSDSSSHRQEMALASGETDDEKDDIFDKKATQSDPDSAESSEKEYSEPRKDRIGRSRSSTAPGPKDDPSSEDKQDSANSHKDSDVTHGSQDEDSDADLPLFQQRKYLEKQKELEQEQKRKIKEQRDKVKIQTNATATSKAAEVKGRGTNKVEQNVVAKTVEEKVERVRRVYESTNDERYDQKQAESMTTKEKAARLALINSRNPNADFNNPNNPNYKGRQTKTAESYQSKPKVKQPREREKEERESPDRFENRREAVDTRREHYVEDKEIYKRSKYDQHHYASYYGEESDEELSSRDYHAYGDEHYYKKATYRRSDFYEDEGTRYRDRYDERDRYGAPVPAPAATAGAYGPIANSRFGPAATSAYYSQYRGRGRGRGRGASLYQAPYEDDYLSVHSSQKRGLQSKYSGYAEDDYYYDEQDERSKYDKKWLNTRQPGEDSREFERESNFRYKQPVPNRKEVPGEKYREDARDSREDEYYLSKYDHDQVMLMRRYRGRTGAYPESSRGRGERGGYSQRGRGTAYTGSSSQYQSGYGRGRGACGPQAEVYQFKPKEKDPQQYHQQARSDSKDDDLEEEKIGQRERIPSRDKNYQSNRNMKVKYIPKSVKSGMSSGYADSQKSEQRRKPEQKSESENEESYSSAKGSQLSDASPEEPKSDRQTSREQSLEEERNRWEENVTGEENSNQDMESETEGNQEEQENEDAQEANKEAGFANENDTDENSKSIYQTFMDVSSIFSRPMLAFGKQKSAMKNKSRFFNEELEGDRGSEASLDDDDLLLNQLNPAALDGPGAFQEDYGQPAQNSIFSSGNLFPNSQQQQRQLGGAGAQRNDHYSPGQQSLFAAFGQNLMNKRGQNGDEYRGLAMSSNQYTQGLSEGERGDELAEDGSSNYTSNYNSATGSFLNQFSIDQDQKIPSVFNQMKLNQNLQEEVGNPAMGAYNSQASTGSNGAGLSSSSFANLRKRALDAGRQQMMQNIIKDTHQNEESKNFEADDGQKNKGAAIQWSSLQDMKKPLGEAASRAGLPSLGALPVPRFLQEQREKMQYHQAQMSHHAMMDSEQFAYQQTPSDNLSSIFMSSFPQSSTPPVPERSSLQAYTLLSTPAQGPSQEQQYSHQMQQQQLQATNGGPQQSRVPDGQPGDLKQTQNRAHLQAQPLPSGGPGGTASQISRSQPKKLSRKERYDKFEATETKKAGSRQPLPSEPQHQDDSEARLATAEDQYESANDQ